MKDAAQFEFLEALRGTLSLTSAFSVTCITTKSSQVKSSQVKSSQVKSSQVKSSQVKLRKVNFYLSSHRS